MPLGRSNQGSFPLGRLTGIASEVRSFGKRTGIRDAGLAGRDSLSVFALLVAIVVVGSVGCGGGDEADAARLAAKARVAKLPARLPASGEPPRAEVAVVDRRPPPPRPSDYVGSESCVPCHAEISARYASHPMSRSLNPLSLASSIETVPSGPIAPGGACEYQVTATDGAVFHHELLNDQSGELIYDQGERVAVAIGSGRQGRAYLIRKGEVFFQSPLGWYSGADRWDLSPGYEPGNHPRFSRRVGDGCLYCHAGRVRSVGEDRYEEPAFAEASIGCERCHGPGGGHVSLHQRRRSDGVASEMPVTDDPIVNPAKLDTSPREDVCNQCHLQGKHVIRRAGRSFFDFRPGDRLEDVFVVLTGNDRVDERGRHQVVSHVEQMRSSRCYVGSEQALGCTSCHDPHFEPEPEARDAWYRDQCARCHADQPCSLGLEEQTAPPANGSCIHCHMPSLGGSDVPHTAQTDHRIIRDHRRGADASPSPLPGEQLAVFDGAELRLPAWEVARARGISKMTEAWQRRDPKLAAEARRLLIPQGLSEKDPNVVIRSLGDDHAALAELGASYLISGETENAYAAWRRLQGLSPEHEVALSGLAFIELGRRNLLGGKDWLERVLRIVPDDADWNSRLVDVEWNLGDRRKAIEVAERALRSNPGDRSLRQWLIRGYEQFGDAAAAERHRVILDQIDSRSAARR